MQTRSLFNRLAAGLIASSLLISACSPRAAAPAASSGYAVPASEAAAPAGAYATSEAYAPAPPTDMFFQDYGVRGFVYAAKDNLSTFAVDVDTGAYTLARSYVQDGSLPPAEAVRTEEFINYFDYDYPNPEAGETFGITVDAGPSPFTSNPNHRMMRVGIQGYAVPAAERPDAVLTFVIDVSGSMDMENRLGLAKRALYLLVAELRPTDQVAIGSMAIPPTKYCP
jgi:Ca-activated chloride channel family protein